MEYCSPLRAGAPASHLARLHAVEIKTFRVIDISCDEAESLGRSSFNADRSMVFVFHPLFSDSLAPALSVLCPLNITAERSWSTSNPLLVKLPKSRITVHLHSFIPLFSPPLEQTPTHSSIPLFPPGFQNSCSPTSLIFPHPKP